MTIINTIAITLIYIMEPYIWVKCLATQGWKKDTWKHPFFWTFLVYYILTLMKQYVALNNLNNNLGTLLMVLLNGYMTKKRYKSLQKTAVQKMAEEDSFPQLI